MGHGHGPIRVRRGARLGDGHQKRVRQVVFQEKNAEFRGHFPFHADAGPRRYRSMASATAEPPRLPSRAR
jgi:hypothetical protein